MRQTITSLVICSDGAVLVLQSYPDCRILYFTVSRVRGPDLVRNLFRTSASA